jgi:hypothetical protein
LPDSNGYVGLRPIEKRLAYVLTVKTAKNINLHCRKRIKKSFIPTFGELLLFCFSGK